MARRLSLTNPRVNGSLLLLIAFVATASGCGQHASGAHPYSPACVIRSFAKAGTTLDDVFGASADARVGVTTLEPISGEPEIAVVVLANADRARRFAASGEVFSNQHRLRERKFRLDGNLVVTYVSSAGNRRRVERGLRQVESACG